jgi:hypothetical protein
MNARDLCLKAFALSTLIDSIKGELGAARDDANAALTKLREDGVSRVDVTLPDGTLVATAALSRPEDRVQVTDRAAFLEWVLANHPDQLRVDNAFERGVVARLKDHDGTVVDADGQVVEWAATVPAGDVPATLRITPVRSTPNRLGGRETFIQAWRAGDLADLGLPAIGAGE